MKKTVTATSFCALILLLFCLPASAQIPQPIAAGNVGVFTAEGKSVQVKFVRVLYAAEGSEIEGESNSVKQLLFESQDPQGNAVQALRFQIVAKNTGYDELQTTLDADYKLKSVTEGIKLHVEIPVIDGEMQLNRAYITNMAYNFGTRETRHLVSAEDAENINLKINKLELPAFGAQHKPGDKGIQYDTGFVELLLNAQVKHMEGDQMDDFMVTISSPISITHVRGQERSDRAVTVDPDLIRKNIR